ncbi:MAG: hypothetical protein IKH60_07820 [Bacteroidales bacterium]|nr:hypothetical protein [Bacteroidales bacterium]
MKETDKMSMTELEAIALDGSIHVPEKLRDDIRTELDTLAFLAGEQAARPRRMLRIAGVAASLALLVGIGLGINSFRNQPKDTFSDPHQAYAMVAASLSFISDKMDESMDSFTQETGAVLTKTNELMNIKN